MENTNSEWRTRERNLAKAKNISMVQEETKLLHEYGLQIDWLIEQKATNKATELMRLCKRIADRIIRNCAFKDIEIELDPIVYAYSELVVS
jgi:hypothetical protein